jgi:hypothetical protein
MRINNPLQLFFLNNPSFKEDSGASSLHITSPENEDLTSGSINMELFLLDKNKIRIRLENLDDLFDSELDYKKLDMIQLCADLYHSVNPYSIMKASDMQIIEMSLTGNQSLGEMRSKRIIWPTVEVEELSKANMNFILGAVPNDSALLVQEDLKADPARTEYSYEILL